MCLQTADAVAHLLECVEWVDAQVELVEVGGALFVEGTGGEEALVGCVCGVVGFADPSVVPLLALELEGGLEEVDMHPQAAVDALEEATLLLAFIACVADVAPHHVPVLLLDVALVVLVIGTAARKLDLVGIAVEA
jgi:hypothetical protein